MLKFIEVVDWKNKKIGEIRFNGKDIYATSTKERNKKFLKEILDVILLSLPKNKVQAFDLILERTSHYSRIFFMNIQEEK